MITDEMVEAACRCFYNMKFGAGSWPNTSKHSIAEWRKRMRAALEAAEKAAWMPISEAPTLERVIVSGVQPRHGTCQAYRWYHEDQTDQNGAPLDHHNADLFRYLPTPPRVEA